MAEDKPRTMVWRYIFTAFFLVHCHSLVSCETTANATVQPPVVQAPQETERPDPFDPISYTCHDNGFLLNTRKNRSEANRQRPGDWVTTCENELLDLDCGRGKVLSIIDAEYGRFDTTTCHSYPMFFMRCEANDAYDKVHQRCDNKQRCRLSAIAEEFGDPCPGIVKYLRVKHKCEAVPESSLISKTVCDNSENSTISCPDGKAIMIVDAFYGRLDATTCPAENITATNCKSQQALDIVSARCDHKSNCSLIPNTEAFDDPCEGTQKYLQIDYQCVEDDLKLGVACQNTEMILACTNMSYINVVRAEYGRTHPFICNKNNKRIEPAGCSSPNELAIVFGKCQGKKICTIPANSQVFGEPCGDKLKYLEVDFFCTERMDDSDSGGPPQIKALGTDRVTFFSDKLNVNNSGKYIAQMKGADEDTWHTVMDGEQEKFDFSIPHTIGGLYSGNLYDARIVKKRDIVSSCLPFTRIRAKL